VISSSPISGKAKGKKLVMYKTCWDITIKMAVSLMQTRLEPPWQKIAQKLTR